ncbi:MAG: 2-oxo acid dehydrogenase subunit E2 [Saprospiraceae bacterium]|nr:2-oxo acid dehydrogenase subunit E2 [Saprospiraceae bacterium]MBL0084397.1 2-oxo acid dehydrogenase subunit E2 [Saprospiraceae bacterium]
MARVDLVMPKMGESIIEATILKWNKKVGDKVAQDETILEVATDKVDSEVPSPVEGVITEILFPESAVVAVGKVIAVISTEGESASDPGPVKVEMEVAPKEAAPLVEKVAESVAEQATNITVARSGDRFYSPLVRNIAKEENVTTAELDAIAGTGAEGRVTKKDILGFVAQRQQGAPSIQIPVAPAASSVSATTTSAAFVPGPGVEIIEMDRMRKLIADHMVMSKQTSPHVTSFVEADVTNLVRWREKNKDAFAKKYGEKITFTPIFIDAVVKAIKDYPLVNVSVEGSKILVKKSINIGMAAALPTGNLIVPVIKNADYLNLAGLTKAVNDLANRARQNKLKPEEIQDGTFTITNVGTFGNLMGTPIINQPQAAILATGAIVKKPAVIETEHGDVIAIRHMMFLSLSYDHRIVDGSLGGAFLKRISDYLEAFKGETI